MSPPTTNVQVGEALKSKVAIKPVMHQQYARKPIAFPLQILATLPTKKIDHLRNGRTQAHGTSLIKRMDARRRTYAVPTIDSLLGPHLNNIQRALGKATERQSLLTANLANLNTPGYKRKDLDFNIILDDSLHGPSTISQWANQHGERSASGTSLRQDGNNVDLEREVFAIAETEQRYQVLSEMAISYFSNLKSVIKEGR